MSNETKYKIIVDTEKCMGCATCSVMFPEIFGYDESTNKSFVKTESATQNDAETLESIVKMCPAQAIKVIAE